MRSGKTPACVDALVITVGLLSQERLAVAASNANLTGGQRVVLRKVQEICKNFPNGVKEQSMTLVTRVLYESSSQENPPRLSARADRNFER